MQNAEEKTAGNGGMVLCLALNYGGRAEIVDAANAVLAERSAQGSGAPITEEELSRRLYTDGLPDPDLLIRTSGEMRVSNFLLWQIAYAEIFVTETLVAGFQSRAVARVFRGVSEARAALWRHPRRRFGRGSVCACGWRMIVAFSLLVDHAGTR